MNTIWILGGVAVFRNLILENRLTVLLLDNFNVDKCRRGKSREYYKTGTKALLVDALLKETI